MQKLTEDGRRIVGEAARRHGVSEAAAETLLVALAAGGGRQAQFNHPDLGGMGQWSQGGMIMIGDMFNNALKARVDALCTDLAAALHDGTPLAAQEERPSSGDTSASLFVAGGSSNRWPATLGAPSSTGSQNDLHYAVFPASRRIAINRGGTVTVYDSGDHRISGFSQQQGGDQSIRFTSQHGLVRLADLPVVDAEAPAKVEAAKAPAPPPPPAPPLPTEAASTLSDDEIFSRIERLADLKAKDIITAEEFATKKAELLARL